ncbi:MAG: AMP-binding protein, partial [Pseudomonadota bacterium]
MSFDTDAPLRIASDALIGQDAARSLCIALIKDFQTAQVRAGRMAREALITDVLARMDPAEQAALAISEDTLAIDSLASMDLIVPINRYFGLATTGIEDHLFMRKTLGDWAELVAHHFELMGADAQITFSTSGSSGPAKHITHGQAVLRAEVQAISDSIFRDVAPPRRVLSAVPPHHIYGFLWSVLMPGHLGAQRLQLHDHAPTATVKRGQAGDVILFTPFLLEKAAAFDLSLKPDVTVVSSGGPMRAETWESAKRLGAARCVEVYGSTETGGIAWRSDPAQPLKLLPHLERMGDGVKARAKDTPLPLQDVIAWENDTSFCVIGRGDRVV